MESEQPRYFPDLAIVATPLRYMDYLLASMIEIGLAHEVEEALAALPAAGYLNALELVRCSAGQAQLSGDWLRQQLDKPAS